MNLIWNTHTLIYTDRLSQSASRLLCHHKMTAEQLLGYKGVAFVYIYIIVALSHVAASQPRLVCTHFYHSTTLIHRPLCVCVSMGSYKESMKESFLSHKKEIHQFSRVICSVGYTKNYTK